MPAWLCARCDGEKYGHLRAYFFPTGVDGPSQAESFIQQNPDISRDVSMWDQHGSKVIWGNLLALPLDQSILYVKPLFLTSETNSLPRLTRVILVNSRRSVMRPTLAEALEALVREQTTAAEGTVNAKAEPGLQQPTTAAAAAPGTTPGPPLSGTVSALVSQANQAYESATKAQQRGDWAAYGAQLKRLHETLQELQRRTNALR